MPHVYYAFLEPEAEGGFTVTFPEIGYGATYGAAWDKALRQAEDMLEEAILGMIAYSEDVPEPAPEGDAPDQDTSRRAPIALPALTAAKLELYRAMRCAKPGSTRRSWPSAWGGPQRRSPMFRPLPCRPPRTARSRSRRARPASGRGLGTGVIIWDRQ